MKWSPQTICGIILCGISVTGQIIAKADSPSASYSQIMIPFPGERPFHEEWIKTENTLQIQFPKSSPAEIEAINNYDEKLVRRVIIKDLGPEGCEVKLVLRDRNVRAIVTSFKDPFRVSIELYDKNYSETKDPTNGLPITTLSGASAGETRTADAPLYEKLGSTAEAPNQISGKRRLLQALPDELNSPNELKQALSKIDPGIGKGWGTYPPYIYRLQLAPYEGREAPTGELSPLQIKAVSTSSAMADYASKLFDFGHEGRALVAYQQVLQKEPGVFEHDALHLWKFAETHLGQGNLTLAQGYYQTLIEKHPDHVLTRFAKLRKIDVLAIRSIGDNDLKKLASLTESLKALPTRNHAELQAMIAIRNAWWTDDKISQKSKSELPFCTEETEVNLTKLMPQIESPKTAYLASAIIANRITNKSTPWQNNYAQWLSNFFSRYKNSQGSDSREHLSEAARSKLAQQFQNLFMASQFTEIIGLYEQLPKEMKSISKDPVVSWQIAESYRNLAQFGQSIPFFETASKADGTLDRFKSNFWSASLAAKQSAELASKHGDQSKIRSLEALSKKSDIAMHDIWSKLKSDEKSILMTALGAQLQDVVASESKLKTPPKILLEQYKTALTSNSPKLNATNGTSSSDWMGNFSPSGSTVKILDDLGKKFAELGLTNERRQSMALMKFLKPSQFETDKAAVKTWASELTKLAEEHRKADEFLEAGELYTLVGEETTNGEGRAESLYKGGLLLFRAGKKQEAMKALEKAKNDSSNLFYSKLATERLNQLDSK